MKISFAEKKKLESLFSCAVCKTLSTIIDQTKRFGLPSLTQIELHFKG